MLNDKQTKLIDDVATLTDALLAQIPVESVEEVKAELVAKLNTLQGQTKPTITDTIGAGLRVLDDAAQLSGNTKFEQVADVLDQGYDVIAGHSGLNIVNLFGVLFKAHKIAKAA
jgi:hypothetical protein